MNRIRLQRRREIFLFIQTMKKKDLEIQKHRSSEKSLLNRLPFINKTVTGNYDTGCCEPNQWDYI